MSAAPALPRLHLYTQGHGQPPAIPLSEAVERSRAARCSGGYVQGSLALNLEPDDEPHTGRLSLNDGLPDPEEWAHRLGLAVAQVLVGLRPPTQLIRYTTPSVYDVIARRALVVSRRAAEARSVRTSARGSRPATATAAAAATARPRIFVRRVRAMMPAAGVAEAAVVVQDGDRVRAMALRLVGFDGRWRIEALEVG